MRDRTKGLWLVFSAYFSWGLFPLFFKAMDHIPALEILPHRIVWAVPTALVVLILLRRTSDILPTLKDAAKVRMVGLAALLISFNWGVYVYAIISAQALQASLGYFISPLITVALGFFVLRETISSSQKIALALAMVGVALQTYDAGVVPWIALALAGSFALYSLVKKTIPVGPAQGFFVETLLVFPLALAAIVYFVVTDQSSFTASGLNTMLLIISGPVTAIPLMLFAAGTRRISLTGAGVMMYIVPTMVFLTAVFVFGEDMSATKLVSFILIWIALALYSVPLPDAWRQTTDG